MTEFKIEELNKIKTLKEFYLFMDSFCDNLDFDPSYREFNEVISKIADNGDVRIAHYLLYKSRFDDLDMHAPRFQIILRFAKDKHITQKILNIAVGKLYNNEYHSTIELLGATCDERAVPILLNFKTYVFGRDNTHLEKAIINSLVKIGKQKDIYHLLAEDFNLRTIPVFGILRDQRAKKSLISISNDCISLQQKSTNTIYLYSSSIESLMQICEKQEVIDLLSRHIRINKNGIFEISILRYFRLLSDPLTIPLLLDSMKKDITYSSTSLHGTYVSVIGQISKESHYNYPGCLVEDLLLLLKSEKKDIDITKAICQALGISELFTFIKEEKIEEGIKFSNAFDLLLFCNDDFDAKTTSFFINLVKSDNLLIQKLADVFHDPKLRDQKKFSLAAVLFAIGTQDSIKEIFIEVEKNKNYLFFAECIKSFFKPEIKDPYIIESMIKIFANVATKDGNYQHYYSGLGNFNNAFNEYLINFLAYHGLESTIKTANKCLEKMENSFSKEQLNAIKISLFSNIRTSFNSIKTKRSISVLLDPKAIKKNQDPIYKIIRECPRPRCFST